MILKTHPKFLLYLLILSVMTNLQAIAFPTAPEDDRYIDREFASPGCHQLASWLLSQLRKFDDVPIEENVSPQLQQTPYRLPVAGKRNSELTSVMMGFPKSMIDNGRK